MTGPEWPQSGIDRAQVTASLLGLIASAAYVSSEFSRIDAYTRTEAAFGAATKNDLIDEITLSAGTVNECLRLIGGISAAWTDSNGKTMQGTFLSCRGFDINSGEWRFDFHGPTYTGQVSATSHRLHDIFLQNQLTTEDNT